MNKPKMILFDYGDTLMYEPDFYPFNGNKVIYPYISENPHNISLEEFSEYLLNLFDEIKALRQSQGVSCLRGEVERSERDSFKT